MRVLVLVRVPVRVLVHFRRLPSSFTPRAQASAMGMWDKYGVSAQVGQRRLDSERPVAGRLGSTGTARHAFLALLTLSLETPFLTGRHLQ